jgi:4-amino-4-deoxy-L-arabinose transferase-like glycosyltransferase
MIRTASYLGPVMTTATRDARQRFPGAKTLGAIIDFATASHSRALAALVLLAVVAFLPGFFQIPPVDRDEARFAQATKQMIETGDYVDIRLQDEVRYKKPVGIYWLQAATVRTASALGVPNALTTIWLYRIPSLLGAIGAVLLTYWTALAFVSRRASLFAAVMMAGSVMLGVEARLAKTDAVLLFTVVVAMGALARVYLTEQRGLPAGKRGWTLPAIFWTALALGVLVKGPLILMFVGLTAAALIIHDRAWSWLRALRPVPGSAWFALLVLPWFLAIIAKAGDSFLVQSVERDMLAKVFSGQEAHGAPPGAYFLIFWATFWPGATLAGLAAPAVCASWREPGTRFLLAWLLPSWILFELVVTKLPHYVLPLYPAIAILIAGTMDTSRLATKPWLARGTVWWLVFPTLLSVGAVGAAIALNSELRLLAWPFAAAAVISGLFAWWLYETDGAERALLRATAASVLLAITVYGAIMPTLRPLFPSATLARVVRSSGCEEPRAAAVGFQEPSLVFLLGTETRMTDGPGAAEFLREGPCRFALVEARQERSFAQRAEATGLRYAQVRKIDAVNISGGRKISIAIYRSEAQP